MTTRRPPQTSTRRGGDQPSGRMLQGSWEGILEQARDFARNGNPEAIPLFQKVITGISRLPEARRRAAEARLHGFYLRAVMGLQSFYATRDRFDDAIQVLEEARPHVDDEERGFIDEHIINLQLMAGHNDTALASLRRQADEPDSEVTDWNPVVWGYIRSDRTREALSLVDELASRYGVDREPAASSAKHIGSETDQEAMAERVAEQAESRAESDEADPAYIRACLEGLRAVVLVELGEYEAGIEAFERSLAVANSPYRHSLHLLYTRLSNAGRYDDALRLIQRDDRYPARRGFWRGLTAYRQGYSDDARAAWRAVGDLDMDELRRAPVESTLARFYLGDPQGETLSGLLGAIRESENPNWTLLMLAGVGFARRGDRETAQNDFRLAVSLLKATGEGVRLPVGVWYMVKDIFKPEDVELFSQYFEMPLPNKTAESGRTSEEGE
jgi:tetratricopeptide (TPR) repeat protein